MLFLEFFLFNPPAKLTQILALQPVNFHYSGAFYSIFLSLLILEIFRYLTECRFSLDILDTFPDARFGRLVQLSTNKLNLEESKKYKF